MKQFHIVNKFFTVGGSSKILDMDKNPVYFVKGKVFSITKKKLLRDLNKNLLYIVRNKFWHLFLKSAFIYDDKKELIMKIKRKISLSSKFNVEADDGQYEINGNIIGWDYEILKDGVKVASVSRQFDWTDHFILTVEKDEFAPLAIAMVIAIDNITDREKGQKS